MTDDEADKAQAWRGMSGATAYHLIDRHADGWEDIDAMMHAWCRAQTAPPAPATPAEIAAYLRDLSRRMLLCGTAMDYKVELIQVNEKRPTSVGLVHRFSGAYVRARRSRSLNPSSGQIFSMAFCRAILRPISASKFSGLAQALSPVTV